MNSYLNLLVVFLCIIYILCVNKTQQSSGTPPTLYSWSINLLINSQLSPKLYIKEMFPDQYINFPGCESL